MASKRRTPLPRSPARKRKPGSKPVSPRPLAAMKYRLAGASYRAIAEKLTDERASEYADANGISFERAMKKIPHVSKRTVWDDVTAEMEDLQERTVRRECSFGNHGSALAWGRAQAARMPRRARPLGRALRAPTGSLFIFGLEGLKKGRSDLKVPLPVACSSSGNEKRSVRPESEGTIKEISTSPTDFHQCSCPKAVTRRVLADARPFGAESRVHVERTQRNQADGSKLRTRHHQGRA